MLHEHEAANVNFTSQTTCNLSGSGLKPETAAVRDSSEIGYVSIVDFSGMLRLTDCPDHFGDCPNAK
jgi:hypothetical protein